MNRLLLAFVLALALPSCVIMPHYETVAGKVSGRVVDSREQPVPGAQVEFLFRSGRQLGSTFTSPTGSFELGPFRQWFYVTYIGSPGVCPFPYTLENIGMPHVLRIRRGSDTAIYMLGDESEFRKQSKDLHHRLRIDLPRSGRWTGGTQPVKLVIDSGMHDTVLPARAHHVPAKPVIFPTQT